MIMVREASMYFREEYWANPVRKGPSKDPIIRFMVARPEILKFSCRTIMAPAANSEYKNHPVQGKDPGMNILDPAFGSNYADGRKYRRNQYPARSSSEKLCQRGISGIGDQDDSPDGQDNSYRFHQIETFAQETDPQEGYKNRGQVGKEGNGGGIFGQLYGQEQETGCSQLQDANNNQGNIGSPAQPGNLFNGP